MVNSYNWQFFPWIEDDHGRCDIMTIAKKALAAMDCPNGMVVDNGDS